MEGLAGGEQGGGGLWKALGFLSLLSPILAELLSGSAPPSEFFQPAAFLLLWAFYGGGALLARELWVRWGGGIGRLMLLGMAYGAIEEGLVIKSWFDPRYYDLAVFEDYGRLAGVNVPWAVWLTVFHTLMSITAPILLAEACFPSLRGRRGLGRRGGWLVLSLFLTGAGLLFVGVDPYRPPLWPYLGAAFLILGMGVAAHRWGEWPLPSPPRWMQAHPAWSGFAIAALLSLNAVILPTRRWPPLLFVAFAVLLLLGFYALLREARTRRSALFGLLTFYTLPMAWLLEVAGVRGTSVVGLLLFLLVRRCLWR